MHIFQTNSPIKKVGPNEYIIGDNKIDPLALIKDKELIIDKVTAKKINGLGSDPLLSTKVNDISGLLFDLIHELDHDPFGGSLSSALGLYFSGHDHSGESSVTGASLDLSELSGNLNSKIQSVSGFLHNLIQQQPTNSITGASGSFEFLNITGTLIVNGIDIYPSISGLLENSSTGSVDISGIQEEIRELELAIEDLKPDGGTYSFSTSLNNSSDIYFIEFPSLFSSPPKLNVSIETTGEAVLIDHIISGVSNSGYHLVFEEVLREDTYVAHTMFDSNGEFAGEEAFEINVDGEIVPSNSPLISDTMWILRNQTDLEVRNNIWRYNTGPEAFTDEISF